jgi:hypothetical protein
MRLAVGGICGRRLVWKRRLRAVGPCVGAEPVAALNGCTVKPLPPGDLYQNVTIP